MGQWMGVGRDGSMVDRDTGESTTLAGFQLHSQWDVADRLVDPGMDK